MQFKSFKRIEKINFIENRILIFIFVLYFYYQEIDREEDVYIFLLFRTAFPDYDKNVQIIILIRTERAQRYYI